jgi:hypothetical protein
MAECARCDKKFTTIYTLKRHIDKKHNNDVEDEEDEEIKEKGKIIEQSYLDEDNKSTVDRLDDKEETIDSDHSTSSQDESDDDSEDIEEEDTAWRRVIRKTLRRFGKKGLDLGENVKRGNDLLQDPYLSEIVKEIPTSINIFNKTVDLIDKSDIYIKIQRKIDAIQKKYPNIPDEEAVKKGWFKKKYDIR